MTLRMFNKPYIEEQLDILRRSCDRGLNICWETEDMFFIDLFTHMKDEIERTKKALDENTVT